ncbi:unnamed protein product, partial [Staurois parvus]
MWGDQAVSCFTVSTLLCRALLCKAIHSSMQELTGERNPRPQIPAWVGHACISRACPTWKCKI